MIADISDGKESARGYERNELHELNRRPAITPVSVLATSRYGSLTRGGLRDAFLFAVRRAGMACTVEDALRCIDAWVEAGAIAADEDGLYRVRQ